MILKMYNMLSYVFNFSFLKVLYTSFVNGKISPLASLPPNAVIFENHGSNKRRAGKWRRKLPDIAPSTSRGVQSEPSKLPGVAVAVVVSAPLAAVDVKCWCRPIVLVTQLRSKWKNYPSR